MYNTPHSSEVSPAREDFENFHIHDAVNMPPQTRSGVTYNEEVTYTFDDNVEHIYQLPYEPSDAFEDGVLGRNIVSVQVEQYAAEAEDDGALYKISLLESVVIDVHPDDRDASNVTCHCSHDDTQSRCKHVYYLMDRTARSYILNKTRNSRTTPPQRYLWISEDGRRARVESRRHGMQPMPPVSRWIAEIGIDEFQSNIQNAPAPSEEVITRALQALQPGQPADESFAKWREIYTDFAGVLAEAAAQDDALRARLLDANMGVLNNDVKLKLRLERCYRTADILFNAHDHRILYPRDEEPDAGSMAVDVDECAESLTRLQDQVATVVGTTTSPAVQSQALDTILHMLWGVLIRCDGEGSLFSLVIEQLDDHRDGFGIDIIKGLAPHLPTAEQKAKALLIERRLGELTIGQQGEPSYQYYRSLRRYVQLWHN